MTFPIGRLSSRIASIPRINTTAAITMSPLKWIPRARYAYIAKTSVLASQRPCYSTTGLNSDHGSSPEANSDHPIHTVNKEEIAKFAAMSDEWWAPQGPFKMLHLFNPPRVRYIRNRLEASGAISNAMTNDSTDKGKAFSSARFPLQGLSIVDIGCGGGLLSEALARLGAQVTGLDASMENIQMARLHSKKDPLLNGGGPGTLEYRHQTAEQLLAEGRQFDVVCSLEVIEHVDNPAGFLKVLGELVKPNGDLILSTISRTALSYFLTILCAEHLLRMVPVGTHHWSKFITPDELKAGVEDLAKCQVLNIQGIGFNPLAGQWELTRSRDGMDIGSGGLLSLLGPSLSEASNYLLAAKKVPSA